MSVSLQEELAFVFEMLQQFEDALVQYDELDALFTQYVLNFGAGGELSPFILRSCHGKKHVLFSKVKGLSHFQFRVNSSLSVHRYSELAGLVLCPGAYLERPAASTAH